jgi:hypothetical protein
VEGQKRYSAMNSYLYRIDLTAFSLLAQEDMYDLALNNDELFKVEEALCVRADVATIFPDNPETGRHDLRPPVLSYLREFSTKLTNMSARAQDREWNHVYAALCRSYNETGPNNRWDGPGVKFTNWLLEQRTKVYKLIASKESDTQVVKDDWEFVVKKQSNKKDVEVRNTLSKEPAAFAKFCIAGRNVNTIVNLVGVAHEKPLIMPTIVDGIIAMNAAAGKDGVERLKLFIEARGIRMKSHYPVVETDGEVIAGTKLLMKYLGRNMSGVSDNDGVSDTGETPYKTLTEVVSRQNYAWFCDKNVDVANSVQVWLNSFDSLTIIALPAVFGN